ncbi:hypothetical protein DPMN_165761 [Dreissena polymorpha]|uniref:Reelin domain-containing protein n=1 Tax=Dreissena polymorpha TaxID=45954 RepID=A0A9D4EXS6_DREPO|nr:hypothetical protein DPMN_165761 [Dreissena polymorpha]
MTSTVTLAGTGGANFRGFLCQARAAIDSDTTVGTLADDDATVTFANNCGAVSWEQFLCCIIHIIMQT